MDYKIIFVGICHTNRKTKVPTHYSHTPGIHHKCNWLAEAGFDTGRGVTVRISKGGHCADGGEQRGAGAARAALSGDEGD